MSTKPGQLQVDCLRTLRPYQKVHLTCASDAGDGAEQIGRSPKPFQNQAFSIPSPLQHNPFDLMSSEYKPISTVDAAPISMASDSADAASVSVLRFTYVALEYPIVANVIVSSFARAKHTFGNYSCHDPH